MTHPTDDDLILRHYADLPADAMAAIDAHLRWCAACRDAAHELETTLRLVDAAEPPEPGPGFERIVWVRVQPRLAPEPARWSWRGLAAVAALSLLVVSMTVVGHRFGPVEPAPPRAGDGERLRERVLLTALDAHFEQAELLLVELMNAPEQNGAPLAFERETADELVASGRLYRITARETGDWQFAEMIEDLEAVFVDLARSPEAGGRAEIDSLRHRIADESLLFRVRAVTNDLRRRQQDLLITTEGPL